MDISLSPEIQKMIDTHRVLSLIPILPYHMVADVGCGLGYFTIPLAKFVFDGTVYALDAQNEMLLEVRKQAEAVRLSNIQTLLIDQPTLPIEDSSLDGAFVSMTLHETAQPNQIMAEVSRSLRKGGWIAVVEWFKKKTEVGPPLKDRIDPIDVMGMAEKAGLRFSRKYSLNDAIYLMVLRR